MLLLALWVLMSIVHLADAARELLFVLVAITGGIALLYLIGRYVQD